jgi:ketosteroid isomerase-like protein
LEGSDADLEHYSSTGSDRQSDAVPRCHSEQLKASQSDAANNSNPVEKTMKIRFLLTLVGLAISFAWPALAQEKAATPAVPNPFQPIPAGPPLVQQVEAINEKFDEAFNKHDATAVAAFYTTNAILSAPLGVASGPSEIEKYYRNLFERFSPSERSTKMNYIYAFGGDLCAIGGETVTITGSQQAGGYQLNVYTKVRGTWKIRATVSKYATGP